MFGIKLLHRGPFGRAPVDEAACDVMPNAEVRDGIDLSFSFRTVDRRAWRVQVRWETLELLAGNAPLKAGDAACIFASRRTELELASLRIIARGAATGGNVIIRAPDVRI